MMTSSPEIAGRSADATAMEAAASWFARLNAEKVTIQDLQAFQAWREAAPNDQAYRSVEDLWRRGETLQGDPDIARTLSALLDRPSCITPSRGVGVGLGAAAALLVAVAFGLWAFTSGTLGAQVYQTAIGQQQDIRLADGSTVRLDTDSRVAVRLGASERRLWLLRGRAFFSVAHDVRHPFVVAARDARVRAIGTRFTVQSDAGDVRVVLIQGVVSVSSNGRVFAPKTVQTLNAGQELSVDGAPSPPTPVDVAFATSWLQGRLSFRNLPLRDAIAEVNRYTAHKLVLGSPDAAGVPVSGTFNTGDPAAFATAAADVCGLEVINQADGSVLLRAKQTQPPG